MIILAIDPGNVQSSYCWYDIKLDRPVAFSTIQNAYSLIAPCDSDLVVIEKVACYGMAVGESVFETCVWTGRLIERFTQIRIPVKRLPRMDVKMHLCKQARARDGNVIQALKDRFGEKGTKKKPGILYGIKADEWQALALAVTWSDIYEQK